MELRKSTNHINFNAAYIGGTEANMKTYGVSNVNVTGGYLFEKQELNRQTTMNAVYDFFSESGRIDAFKMDYKDGDEKQPHIFWDSDVAKWMEAAAYILEKRPDPELEAKVDAIVDCIEKGQAKDGYFNIFFTVVQPGDRFTDRDYHELYCAGHLMEAAVAYAEATGKTKFLDCMEKYADCIYRVFVEEKSAKFFTPGHEELELALARMYRYTGKRKYLDLSAHFINVRGTVEEKLKGPYNQSHVPVREQREAVGHAVRAVYLYTGMAALAKETGDEELLKACRILYEDMTTKKMYVTGGLGSTNIGEAFSIAYDLPNDRAYSETCAAIGMMLFSNAMLSIENRADYADSIERAIYNGVLSGLSYDGKRFFYENPLEISLTDRSVNTDTRYPAAQRPTHFGCSCCPPNMNRILASIGAYIYGLEEDALYVNQFIASELSDGNISCVMTTDYPRGNTISIKANGVNKIAIRIPGWAKSFTLNKTYVMESGYAIVENDGGSVTLTLDMTPEALYADCRVAKDVGKLCIRRGPIVYCAEGVDNEFELHSYSIPQNFSAEVIGDGQFGLPELSVVCERLLPYDGALYSAEPPKRVPATLRMIPYNSFANRGLTDMAVWIHASR